jgi:oxygen-independent coproporphyrinogen III oxidase
VNAVSRELLARYSAPGPRYTSYPTVMHWSRAPTAAQWTAALDAALQAPDARCGIYVHIPFCQSLCTFCGCNMRLVRNHALAAPYVDTLLAEFALYRQQLSVPRLALGELHLGGGTPTYLPAGALDRLLDGVLQHAAPVAGAELAIEVDPRNTTREQLTVLRRHGFNRLSMGVQDFDARVLQIVDREQTEAEVRRVVDAARELGFSSLSFDLIYGLPLQTLDSMRHTFDATERLAPDRVSFLPYAHVPWIKQSQRQYTEADLPDGVLRQQLLLLGRERLGTAGFVEIGMDQYARREEALTRALTAGTLHRNFMGFTASATQALIGPGVSAIGGARCAYAQNEKGLQPYEARVRAGELPLQRGHVLSDDDQRVRDLLWQLLTVSHATLTAADVAARWWPATAQALQTLQGDGLVLLADRQIRVTDTGRSFLRHIGMAFDDYLRNTAPA